MSSANRKHNDINNISVFVQLFLYETHTHEAAENMSAREIISSRSTGTCLIS